MRPEAEKIIKKINRLQKTIDSCKYGTICNMYIDAKIGELYIDLKKIK